jgi:hypothetical protein
LRIKEQETCLTLQEHGDDDDIRIHKSRAIFERNDRKISKKEKIGIASFRGAIMLLYFTGILCTT